MLLVRDTIRRWVSAGIVSAIVTIPTVATAQVMVRTIVFREQPVSETFQIHLSRFAELTEEPRIAIDTALDVGDLFWAVTPDSGVALELGCGSSAQTVFRFSGPFRVVVLPPRPDVPCVLQLLSGGVDVRADEPTEINAGGIVLGSRGTQYAVRLRREAGEPVCEGFVYEDDLEVTTAHAEKLPVVQKTAWTYNFAQRAGRTLDIPQAMYTESALIATNFDLARFQARVDVSTPPEEQRVQVKEELLALHTAALQAPADPETRTRLGTTQKRLGIADGARYNLIRAERIKLDPARSTLDPAKPPQREPPAAQREAVPRAPAAVTTRPIPPSAVRSVERASVLEPSARALALVRAGNPAEAIALLQPRVDASQATTRDFYTLAEAYVATGNRAAATRAAGRALAAPDAATALTPDEIERLRSLRGRYR